VSAHSIATVVWILLIAAPAFGQDRTAEAKAAFQEGSVLFERGRYAEAAAAFREANDLAPSWKLYYNIGQSEAAAKRHGLALEAFEAYLSAGGDDLPFDRREEVLDEVRRLRDMVGFLEIEAPDGARVIVDGVERGCAPLRGSLPVAASVDHTVEVVPETGAALERVARVAGAQTSALDMTAREDLAEAPAPDGVGGADPRAETGGETSPLAVAGWVVLAAGGAALAAGTVTGILALKADEDIVESCPDGGCYPEHHGDLDRRDDLALSTDVLLAVGAAGAAVGAVLLIVDAARGESAGDVALRPAPGGLAVAWR